MNGHIAKQRVARAQRRRVGKSDDVTGPGAVQGGALLTEHRLGVLGDERLAGGRVGQHVTTFERAGTHPGVGDAVAVRGVHPGLHLEHESAERGFDRTNVAVGVALGARRRRQPDQIVQQLVDAEVQCRRGEQHRRGLAPQERLLVVIAAVGGEQFAFLDRVDPVDPGGLLGPVRRDVLLGGRGGPARGAGEADEVAGAAIQHALEVAGDTHRPGQRRRFEADALGDLVEQFQRVTARSVPFVDHGQDRDAAVTAHLEELEGLRFQTLGGVDQHHRAVDRRQHPVGVLGEVGVPGVSSRLITQS